MKNLLFATALLTVLLFATKLAFNTFDDESYLEDNNEISIPDEPQTPHQYIPITSNDLVSPRLLNKAKEYFNSHRSEFRNQDYITTVDFSQHSSLPRMSVIDTRTGGVLSVHVAHGSGSDPDNDGYATVFSNMSGSQMSSVGPYKTAWTYIGYHGRSLRIDGLANTNSNAMARAVVVHGSDYVYTKNIKPGRSWGCFAVPNSQKEQIINMIKGGSLIYAAD